MVALDAAWDDQEGIERARALYRETHGAEPDGVWASPGRVNVIGEHVDYNDGLCLPIALPHRTWVAVGARDDQQVRLVTDLAPDEPWHGTLDDIAPGLLTGWPAYTAGPAWALRQDGLAVPGFCLAAVSCVPIGAGLSSSAAVECAVGLALSELSGRPAGSVEGRARLAELCVRAENEVAQAPTGGLDQAASLRCRAGSALLLDCATGEVEHVPFDLEAHDLRLLVVDSRASHSLADGQYGKRRASCEQAAAALGVDSLREVADATDPDDLDGVLARLDDPVVVRRCRHVLTEIWRTGDFVQAMRAGQWQRAGQLMVDSHASLRDDYEVTVAELDVIVEAAMRSGALGARMTGGGFGGSVIALVPAALVDRVADAVQQAARSAGHPEPLFHLAVASDGGQRVA